MEAKISLPLRRLSLVQSELLSPTLGIEFLFLQREANIRTGQVFSFTSYLKEFSVYHRTNNL
jgi:hypothetical protein